VVVASFEPRNPASPEARLATGAEATSDPDGRFQLDGLDAGRYRVRAGRQGLAPASAEHVPTGTKDLTLRLAAGATLQGKVVDRETGKPVSAFVVDVWRRLDALRIERVAGSMVVEPEGRYQLGGLPRETLQVSVSAQGFAASPELSVDLSVSPAVADFQLGRGARLTGTVLDRATKEPIEGAKVHVEGRLALGAGPGAANAQPWALTDAQGRFALTGLRAGALSFAVAATGHHARMVSGLTAPEAGDLPPVTVELAPTQADEDPRLELAGIGVVLAAKGDGLEIGQVVPGGGAADAGLVPGDLVLAVDGRPVKDLGFVGTVNLIRGPEGTQVTLLVRRAAGGEPTPVVVTRKLVKA